MLPEEMELPAVPGDITAAWLSSKLGRQVRSTEITHILRGTATKVYMTLTYDNADNRDDPRFPRPTQLCAKGGFDPPLIAQMPWTVTLYEREVEFFNSVAPTLRHMNLPKFWWAGTNHSSQGIVLMEDLAAQGCQFGDPLNTWSLPQVRAGMEQLAALHAATWGARDEDYPWLTQHYDVAILSLMQTYEDVVRRPDRPLGIPEYMKDQKRLTAVLKKHYGSRNPKFRCLLHGDPHTANTYFVQGQPRFMDWQAIHLGSAFHDVAYFIASALSIEDRRLHEVAVLDRYLLSLSQFGGPNLSCRDEDVLVEYRKSLLSGIGWILCPYEFQAREHVCAMAPRYAAALDDHKVWELVESLPDA